MVVDIFKKFDMDEDGRLCLEEFNNLQKATEGESAVDSKIQDAQKGFRELDVRNLYLDPAKRRAYRTDLQKDHIKIFGPGAGSVQLDEKNQEGQAPGFAAGIQVRLKNLS